MVTKNINLKRTADTIKIPQTAVDDDDGKVRDGWTESQVICGSSLVTTGTGTVTFGAAVLSPSMGPHGTLVI